MQPVASIAELPFARVSGDRPTSFWSAEESGAMPPFSFARGSDYWYPTRTGRYTQDCARGRAYADELLTYIRDTGSSIILGHVAAAMVAGVVYGPVEIGFWSRINVALVRVSR